MRVGMGYDLHRLVPGEPLILGGVTIDFELGLMGHSDADVLTHALIDALLGAMARGDIGQHFPDSDPRYRDIDSLILLDKTRKIMAEDGYVLVNGDLLIMAQSPRIGPYRQPIIDSLAGVLKIEQGQLNLKATTTEKLGIIGRQQAIAAQAGVLIKEGEI
ncbi:MAG: 2-C-methyl-D-erythritol 2,4-cyclodiphosphate synthase [Bacillota bacterium]